jgi:Putative bacterial sensory transduction regulator
MRPLLHGSLVLAVLLAAVSPGKAEDDKIFKTMTPEQTEAFLAKMEIDFKKAESKAPGTFMYDFKRKSFTMRLYHFDGKDLMVDAVFPAMTLDRVNDWNLKAKFSRATLQKDARGLFVTLESNLDLVGGVTEGALKQFILSFDDEVRLFAKYAGGAASEEQFFSPVTDEKLGEILKSMSFEYTKKEGKSATLFEFEFENRKFRLTNFAGKDIMLDTAFKKISVEDCNAYNLQKKFIRVVEYDARGEPHSSLEANLDCEIGTTDGILRYFILGFTEDAKAFGKYVQTK